MREPGRNDPCPCGNGKKFKKCHGDPKLVGRNYARQREIPDDVRRTFEAHTRREHAYQSRFGAVRRMVSTEFQGHRLVAVGNRVHFSKKWRTVPDFLSDYLKTKVPEPWYKSQLDLSVEERHPLAQWYWHYCAFQARNAVPGPDGLCSGEPDGPSMSYLVLAHELYLLDDNLLLQDVLIRRLLQADHFQGARYEITVAATMIRAGFTLEMEDESHPGSAHPEFVATHRITGTRVAVEAKSRRRGGILGQRGEPRVVDNLAHDLRRLFRDALRKASELPLFVFIDANLPPEEARSMSDAWQPQFDRMVVEEAKPIDHNGVVVKHPHNLLIVSNVGHHRGAPSGALPGQLFYFHWPQPWACQHPVSEVLIREVGQSMRLYGQLPSAFDQ